MTSTDREVNEVTRRLAEAEALARSTGMAHCLVERNGKITVTQHNMVLKGDRVLETVRIFC